MKKRFDKKFSEKARSALEGYEHTGYDPADWQALSGRLYRRKAWLANLRGFRHTFLTLCLGIVFSLLTFQPVMRENDNRIVYAGQTAPDILSEQLLAHQAHQKDDARDLIENKAASRRLASRTNVGNRPIQESAALTRYEVDAPSEGKNNRPSPPDGAATAVLARAASIATADHAASLSPNVKEELFSLTTIRSRGAVLTALAQDDAIDWQSSLAERPQLPQRKRPDRMQVSLAVFPVLNYHEGEGMAPASFGAGLAVDYRLTDRWSLGSGVFFSQQSARKVEKVSQEIPLVSSTETATMRYTETTNAQIGVLDVPLQLRYRFADQSSRSFYVSAGVSNYLYFDETYVSRRRYEELPSGAAAFRQTFDDAPPRSYPNMHSYDLAGATSLSVALEQRLSSDGLSITLEPFVKLPNRPLASENVNLMSFGALTRIRF